VAGGPALGTTGMTRPLTGLSGETFRTLGHPEWGCRLTPLQWAGLGELRVGGAFDLGAWPEEPKMLRDSHVLKAHSRPGAWPAHWRAQ
jgi:hypothetical protein